MDDESDVVSCWQCGMRFPSSVSVCLGCGAPNVLEREDDLVLPAPPRKSLFPGVFAGVLAAVLLVGLVGIVWIVTAQ